MAIYEINNVPADIPFEDAGKNGLLRTLSNAKNLMMLRTGEVPYDRTRGIDARIYDMPIVRAREIIVQELDRVFLDEPFVEVVDATIELDEDSQMIITARIETAIDDE